MDNMNLNLMKIKIKIKEILLKKIMTIKIIVLRDFLKKITIYFLQNRP